MRASVLAALAMQMSWALAETLSHMIGWGVSENSCTKCVVEGEEGAQRTEGLQVEDLAACRTCKRVYMCVCAYVHVCVCACKWACKYVSVS